MTSSHLFVAELNGTNSFKVKLNSVVNLSRLRLQQYSITGVPTTNGVPDQTHLNLTLDGSGLSTFPDWAKNDSTPGYPLALTGAFTHKEISTMDVITTVPVALTNNFTVKLTNPDGTLAVFEKVAFWFVAQ